MPSDLDLMRQRVGSIDSGYQQALDRRLAGFAAITEQNREDKLLRGKTREEKERFKREQAAQAKRDARLNLYDVQGTNQRAGIAADAAYNQQGYTMQRDKQQTLDQLKRDAAQQGYTLQRDAGQQRNQLQRDAIQQDYGVQNDERQFGYQAQRDARLQGYDVQNDERRFGQQIQRDAQQQDYGVQNDERQFEYQGKRDERLQGYGVQNDERTFGQQLQRDERLQGYGVQNDERTFGYQKQRDERLQGYDQENMYQREAADVSAKWMDQVQHAKSSGMDFSQRQNNEMKEMDRAFRQNVLNGSFDEGQKQQLYLSYQKKLSTIVPEEKTSKPADEMAQTFFRHPEFPELGILQRSTNQRGNVEWQALGSGKQDAENPTTVRLRKADYDREVLFQKTKDKFRSQTDGLGEPLYTPDQIEELAREDFKGLEEIFRRQGLDPHSSYKAEADAIRHKEKIQQIQQMPREQRTQYDQLNSGPKVSPSPMPSDQQASTRAIQPPVISTRSPLSPDVSKQLKARPGGDQLHKLREKHSSNSGDDQTIRLAADVVINSMLTKDTSDPDLNEAIDILRRAGFKLE